MMITPKAATRSCAICERRLLTGEEPIRFAPNGGDRFVDVCPLCQEVAIESGWLKEGSPTTPRVTNEGRRSRRPFLGGIFELRRPPETAPVASEPILRRLSETELAMVEAAELFNASQARRTSAGIARSLGEPRASIVPLSGVNTETVVTVAWDISWYQYRVAPGSAQPVRLEERGHELAELEPSFTSWNAKLTRDGRLVPDIARI